jgi:hypothetical protein
MGIELDCMGFEHIVISKVQKALRHAISQSQNQKEYLSLAACETAEATGISKHSVSVKWTLSTVTV